jgi:hypothetical protein
MKTQINDEENVSTNTVQLSPKKDRFEDLISWPDDLADRMLRTAAIQLTFHSECFFNKEKAAGRREMASDLLRIYLKSTPRSYQLAIGKYIRSSIQKFKCENDIY